MKKFALLFVVLFLASCNTSTTTNNSTITPSSSTTGVAPTTEITKEAELPPLAADGIYVPSQAAENTRKIVLRTEMAENLEINNVAVGLGLADFRGASSDLHDKNTIKSLEGKPSLSLSVGINPNKNTSAEFKIFTDRNQKKNSGNMKAVIDGSSLLTLSSQNWEKPTIINEGATFNAFFSTPTNLKTFAMTPLSILGRDETSMGTVDKGFISQIVDESYTVADLLKIKNLEIDFDSTSAYLANSETKLRIYFPKNETYTNFISKITKAEIVGLDGNKTDITSKFICDTTLCQANFSLENPKNISKIFITWE